MNSIAAFDKKITRNRARGLRLFATKTVLVFFFLLLNLAFPTANASVGKGFLAGLHIYGEIKQGDYEKVVTNIREGLQRCPLCSFEITIDSPGGDVMEAMKIGRLLRENLIKATIRWGYLDENNEILKNPGRISRCYSACVLLMMGGVQREFEKNSIGIHRAFIQRSFNKDISLDESQKLQKELSKLVESYISEMGGSKALFEKMMSVDSSDLQTLSHEEFDSLIGTNEPATHEWLYSKCEDGNLTSDESVYIDWFPLWKEAYSHFKGEIKDDYVKTTLARISPTLLESALVTKFRIERCETCELVNARNRRLGVSELRPEPCYD